MAGHPSFEIVPATVAPTPIIVHVPHSSTSIPGDVRTALLLSDAELAEELRRLTDHRTEVLASGAGQAGATRFVNLRSRLVVDPERFTEPAVEEMEAVGMGAVYTATSDGRPLREPAAATRRALLDRYFHPYHAAFTSLVDDQLAEAGWCTIVDVHSYPSEVLPYELHRDDPRPELCIGTDGRHTPAWLRELVVEVAQRHGVTSGFDVPFRGSFVPSRHLGDGRISTVMLEIRRDTYLDETTAQPHAGEARMRQLCTDLVVAIADERERSSTT